MNKMSFAEKYLGMGFGLIPLLPTKKGEKNSGKAPAGKGFLENPIKSREVAQSWWEDKDFNIGIVTGKQSGVVVLDIDHPEIFDQFLTKHPECRNTLIVRRNNAPQWRCHYYFKLDAYIPKSKKAESTGWGDILSDGKYVVAPPSFHYSGGVYEIINDTTPLPFKEEYMVDLLLAHRPGKKNTAKEKSIESVEEAIPEGKRNNTLFDEIKRLRNQGCSRKEAEDAALEFCQKCVPPYDETEAMKTVTSVYDYHRTEQRQKTLEKLNYCRETTQNKEGETEYKLKPLSFDLVLSRFQKLLNGKVVNINDELVALPNNPEDKLVPLRNATDVFSYLGTVFKGIPDWRHGQGYMSKDELFSALIAHLPEYESVEKAPHFPLLSKSIYLLPELPAADMTALNWFLDFFSPETPYDRDLILAMFLTTLWGGPAGQRAPFLVTSKDGRGVGKSTLAETAAKLLNQVPIQASTRLDADSLTTRLLSWEAMKSRIVLFDNEVATMQKISNAGMAALFTAGEISGKRLYKGEGSRPNYLIWIMTLNSVTFDSDFASRCIPIALKKPPHTINWQDKLNAFIESYRWVLIATMIELLKKNTKFQNPVTRWGLWENQVLSKVPGIKRKEVLDLIVSRQKQNDCDQEEHEMIVDAIRVHVNSLKETKSEYFISSSEMADIARNALHLKGGNSWILSLVNELINKGDCPALTQKRFSHARGYLWIPELDE